MGRKTMQQEAFKQLMTLPVPPGWENASTFKWSEQDAWMAWTLAYRAAAEKLAEAVKRGRVNTHAACLPLGFLYHHAIEMSLKLLVKQAGDDGIWLYGADKANRSHSLTDLCCLVDQVQEHIPYHPAKWKEHRNFLRLCDAGTVSGFFWRYPAGTDAAAYDTVETPVFDFSTGETKGRGGIASYQLGGIFSRFQKAALYLHGYQTYLTERPRDR